MIAVRSRAVAALSLSVFSFVAGCSAAGADDDVAVSDAPLISDASSITRRSDGQFDVQCRDGRTEVATDIQVQAGAICKTQSVVDGVSFTGPSDPLNPASCAGAPWTLGAVETRLPGGSLTAKLPASAAARAVTRSCALRVTGTPTCSAWSVVPTVTFRNVALELVESPLTQNATASLTLQNTGRYNVESAFNSPHQGWLVSNSDSFVVFGIAGAATVSASGASPLVARGYAGPSTRDPVALLLGAGTTHPQPDGVFWWGSTSSSGSNNPAVIAENVPDTSTGTKLAETLFTTSCARMQFRSVPPPAGVAAWTELLAAVVATY